MEIASFSPSVSRSRLSAPSLSIMLAPVHALLALFIPIQPARANHRPMGPASKQHLASEQQMAGRAAAPLAMATNTLPHKRPHDGPHNRPISCLKIIREVEPGMGQSQSGRMAISGRMADVCAELDRIAQKEALKA
jgi:hypothetical protein